jgi:hypothetical protein
MKLDLREITAGGLVISLGLFVAIWSIAYPTGTVARMGPGFFPRYLGVIMLGLGVAILLFDARAARKDDDKPQEPAFLEWRRLRAMAILIAAPLTFAILIEPAGLIAAVFATVFISAFADESISYTRAALLGVGMSLASALIFKVVLNLPFDLIG